MTRMRPVSLIPPTRATTVAQAVILLGIVTTAAFLVGRYPALPWLLPVHFKLNGVPNGWQYKTWLRVMTPVLIQVMLLGSLGLIGTLLRSRGHDRHEPDAPDVVAARVASEAVTLILAVWVVFQSYAAVALADVWIRQRGNLGPIYVPAEAICLLLTVVIGVITARRLGRPTPKPFRPEHWRFGQLYRNPDDPALFVPTRDGSRWTLNFGRPVAAGLLGAVLLLGVLGPTAILILALRYRF
jgi:uncharacterized membrane protein